MILFGTLYYADKIRRTKSLNIIEILIPFFTFMIPLYSAIMAFLYWGQPIVFGISTQKFWFIGLSCIMVFYFLKAEYLSIKDIHVLLLSLGWICLFIYFSSELVFNARNFRGTNYVYCNLAKGGCGFRFSMIFISYATCFYLLKSIKEEKMIYLIPVLLFFSYLFFYNQKRSTIIITGLLGVLMLLVNRNWKLTIRYSLYFTFLSITTIILLLVFNPQKISIITTQYGNLFDVIQGEETNESSADSRLREMVFIYKVINEKPSTVIFGNGKWSDNWSNSPAIANKFYPSDLGIIGSVFVYGIVGVLLVHLQFVFVIIMIRRKKYLLQNIIYLNFLWFLLYYYMAAILTGGIFFAAGPAICQMLIVLIYYFYEENSVTT